MPALGVHIKGLTAEPVTNIIVCFKRLYFVLFKASDGNVHVLYYVSESWDKSFHLQKVCKV